MARPNEPESFRTLRNRKRDIRDLINEGKRKGENVTELENELNVISTKLNAKISKGLNESAENVSFSQHNSNEMTTNPNEKVNEPAETVTKTPESGTETVSSQNENPVIPPPINENVPPKEKSLLEQMQEMASKRVSDIKPEATPLKEVKLEAPADTGNEYFEPLKNETDTVTDPLVTELPNPDTESPIADNFIELFLDNDLVSDILIEGTETLFIEWYPTLYISSKFTKEEQKILMVLQFRMEKQKNKFMETIEENEFEVLQKYLLLEEYRKKLPYSKSERDNLQRCIEKLLKNKAIKVKPETGLMLVLGMAFAKRTFPIYDDKIADVISSGTDRLFTWLERVTDKAENKRNTTEHGAEE